MALVQAWVQMRTCCFGADDKNKNKKMEICFPRNAKWGTRRDKNNLCLDCSHLQGSCSLDSIALAPAHAPKNPAWGALECCWTCANPTGILYGPPCNPAVAASSILLRCCQHLHFCTTTVHLSPQQPWYLDTNSPLSFPTTTTHCCRAHLFFFSPFPLAPSPPPPHHHCPTAPPWVKLSQSQLSRRSVRLCCQFPLRLRGRRRRRLPQVVIVSALGAAKYQPVENRVPAACSSSATRQNTRVVIIPDTGAESHRLPPRTPFQPPPPDGQPVARLFVGFRCRSDGGDPPSDTHQGSC